MADRRDKVERRGKGDRRRHRKRRNANEQAVVIEVSGNDLRVVVLDRDTEENSDTVQVAVVPWRVDAVNLNSDLGVRELSEALRRISQDFQLQNTQVQFVLGGEFCVTKALQGKNDDVRSELQQIKLRSRLYLMLGPGEKVSVSSSRPIDARHEYAVAAICNQKTLQTLQTAATNAGVKVERIEPALVSISRVVDRINDAPTEPSLVVLLDKGMADLGICHQGHLLLDYRPGGLKEPEQLVELIRTHLSRLQRHVGRQLHEAPPKLERVYLCGDKEAVEKAYPAFAACDRFKVHQIKPNEIQASWNFTNQTVNSSAVPALGGLLGAYLPESERAAPNFMEHIIASTRVPITPILLRSAIPLAAIFLVACSLWIVNFREQAAVDALQRRVVALMPVQARARELQLKLVANRTRVTHLSHLGKQVQSLPAGGVVGWIGQCMPSDVWLTNLEIEDMKSIKLAGASFLEAGVFDFVRWLEQSPYFSDVALRGTQTSQSPSGAAINFDVELSLNDNEDPVDEVARNE